jgi:hypothetical protein
MVTRLASSVAVAVIAFVAAWLAMLPGVAFWDTGELQAVAPVLGTAHPTGFPTYVLLGWLASVLLQPFGEPAFRMNLFSALCLALAAGVTVDLVRLLTGRIVLGIAAGVGLALTPIAWTIATHAEAHTLHVALVAILLWLLVQWDAHARRGRDVAVALPVSEDAPEQPIAGAEVVADAALDPTAAVERPPGAEATAPKPTVPGRVDRGDRFLVAAAVVFGLAVGNHSLTLLLAVPVGLYVLAVDPGIWRRGRLVVACAVALLLTVTLVYLELPLRAGPFRAPLVYGTPDTWDGFRYIVLAEQFQGSLSDPFGNLPGKLGELVSRTVAQFGILAPLIPVGFVVTVLRRPRYALLTGSAVAITCFFAASYVNADISRYYVGPALMAWTWLAILAAAIVDVLSSGDVAAAADGAPVDDAASVDAPSLGRPATSRPVGGLIAVLIAIALVVPTLADAPLRFKALDMSGRREAILWTDHVLDVMEPHSVILSWWSYSTPLWYAQKVEGRRTDIAIVDDRTRLDENLGSLTDVIDANLGRRPVYVMRLDQRELALLAERYNLDYIDGTDASALTRVIGLKAAAS